MKHVIILLVAAVLPLVAIAQSVNVTRSLEMLPNSQAVVQFNNIFGNWENREVDDSFPYVVIQMNLAGDAKAVSSAKQKIGLDVGTMYQVTATDKNQPNKILFLVPRGVRNIYVICGDGCEKQLLHSGTLVENKVYECTVAFQTNAPIANGSTDDLKKQVEEIRKQNEEMRRMLQNLNGGQQEVSQAKVIMDSHGTVSKYPGTVVRNGILVEVPKNIQGVFEIGDDVDAIGDSAFFCCKELKEVIIPTSVKKVGDCAFFHCVGLTSVTIPNSVMSIGDYAFFDCVGLTNVTISNSVTNIGKSAFEGCKSLNKVTIPSGVTTIGALAFAYCSNLADLTIPNSVKSIGDFAFFHCINLTGLTIPFGLTSLSKGIFGNCKSLSTVTIPNSVTYIGVNAFSNCTNLTNVTLPGSIIGIEEGAFNVCDRLKKIYVPVGAKEQIKELLPSKLRRIVVEL